MRPASGRHRRAGREVVVVGDDDSLVPWVDVAVVLVELLINLGAPYHLAVAPAVVLGVGGLAHQLEEGVGERVELLRVHVLEVRHLVRVIVKVVQRRLIEEDVDGIDARHRQILVVRGLLVRAGCARVLERVGVVPGRGRRVDDHFPLLLDVRAVPVPAVVSVRDRRVGEDRSTLAVLVAPDRRQRRDAVERRADLLRLLAQRELEKRWQDVGHVHEPGVGGAAPRQWQQRAVYERRHTDAALVRQELAASQGPVRATTEHARHGAVVRHEPHERVLVHAQVLHFLHQTAHRVVELADARRERRALFAAGGPVLVLEEFVVVVLVRRVGGLVRRVRRVVRQVQEERRVRRGGHVVCEDLLGTLLEDIRRVVRRAQVVEVVVEVVQRGPAAFVEPNFALVGLAVLSLRHRVRVVLYR
mmetsp:Transcript_14299/g.37548  ORF Transcript_14299/g.37548 Transcript_14299/m.37548 type:complete len:416 (-) Transcript_14299:119-1366(-)